MFQELQVVLIITMLEAFTRDLRFCLAEGGEVEDFPYTDVFKMIIKEVGSDTRVLYLVAYSPRVKALMLKITNQLRFGEFEPLDLLYRRPRRFRILTGHPRGRSDVLFETIHLLQ